VRRWTIPGATARRRCTASAALEPAGRAAVSEGIVPGGGTALLRAEAALAAGADIVRRVLAQPLFWIATNAGRGGAARAARRRDSARVRRPGRGLACPSSPI
jgi:chaperonin GroEL